MITHNCIKKVYHNILSQKLTIYRLSRRFCTEKAQQLTDVITDSDKKIRITTTKPITEVAVKDVIGQDKILPPIIKTPVDEFVPFTEVPGPRVLKSIAKAWEFIPTFGNQVATSTIKYMLGSHMSWGNNARLFQYLMNEYGPVVRLQSPFGGDVVILSRSEDANAIFSNEGKFPVRSSLDCIEKYRLEYRNYKSAGPFLTSGEDWQNLRSEIEKPLSETFLFQCKKIESVCDDFVLRIRSVRNRQEEVPKNFIQDVYKWALECLCTVLFGRKFGFMDERLGVANSDAHKLFEAFQDATNALKKCETGLQLWRFFETPAWKSLIANCDTIDSILDKNIKDLSAKEELKNFSNISVEDHKKMLDERNIPILESLLKQNKLTLEEVLTVFLDMILIGANASTHGLSFLLYHLARNPRVQRKLADEIKSFPESVEPAALLKNTYLSACIKESLRLKPPIPILSRVLTSDVIVHNYKIPAGTVVLMATYLSSLREENFDEAQKFVPERWIDKSLTEEHNFATIPFGFGARACLAKNLADMQLSLVIYKIMKAFRIEYHYGNIVSTNTMLATPDRDLKFRFVNRYNFNNL